jgi:hypothetical protein
VASLEGRTPHMSVRGGPVGFLEEQNPSSAHGLIDDPLLGQGRGGGRVDQVSAIPGAPLGETLVLCCDQEGSKVVHSEGRQE